MNGDGNGEKLSQKLDVVTYIRKGEMLGLEVLERHGGENWRVVAEVAGQIGEGQKVMLAGGGAHELLLKMAISRAGDAGDYWGEPLCLVKATDLDLMVEEDTNMAELVNKLRGLTDCKECKLLTPKSDGVSWKRIELELKNGQLVDIVQVENIRERMAVGSWLTHQGVGLELAIGIGGVTGATVIDETDYLESNPIPFQVTGLNPKREEARGRWGEWKRAMKAVGWMAAKGGSVTSADWPEIGKNLIEEIEGERVGTEQRLYIRREMAEMMMRTYSANRFLFWQAMVFKIPGIVFFSPTMARGFMDHPGWQSGILLELGSDETSGSKIKVGPQVMWERVIELVVAEAANDVDLEVVIGELAQNWPKSYPVDWVKIGEKYEGQE